MKKIVEGVEHFHESVYPSERQLFEGLAHGQHPRALMITCADSRIDPSLFTQTKPGEIFYLRNAGNIVPPYSAMQGAEAATIEYALTVLNIRNIIVCGHTDCGAMKGLLARDSIRHMPAVTHWLRHAESARRIADSRSFENEQELLDAVIEENVLAQLLNLQTHPTVAAKLFHDEIHLFGWVYDIGRGQVKAYCPRQRRFIALDRDVEQFDVFRNPARQVKEAA